MPHIYIFLGMLICSQSIRGISVNQPIIKGRCRGLNTAHVGSTAGSIGSSDLNWGYDGSLTLVKRELNAEKWHPDF